MQIHVTDQDGIRHTLEALEGFRVMEIIRDWGLDIKAECGGACACATCHVYVDEAWTKKRICSIRLSTCATIPGSPASC